MMAGLFASAQPEYAALGIATFPFDATAEVKRGPLVSHYNRVGLPRSRQMVLRFADAPGLAAMAGARNRFTVIDIDERGAPGERLLADVQRQFGDSKFVVRTGSGGFHAYYRHNGEGRKIRPDLRKPIDLIGDGPIVLPPSRGFKGSYEIIHGRLEDLANLKPIGAKSSASLAATDIDLRTARDGGRDKKFWGHVARQAHLVKSFDELIDIAREMNELMAEPWSDTEVDSEIVKRCKYWWDKTQKGKNWFGIGRYVRTDHSIVDKLMMSDPDAFQLLIFLQRNHWGRDFALANETAQLLPLNDSKRGQFGWDRERFAGARQRLIDGGYLIVVRAATIKPPKPMMCRLRKFPNQ
jgi:hypothetical protein